MTEAPLSNMPWLTSAWRLFQDRLEAERLAHALLLHGPAGTGKSLLARSMLSALLCLEPDDRGACGRCRSCALLESGAHPDAFPVSLIPNKNTGKIRKEIIIEQIRELIASMTLTTTISRRKVALVEPADAMNRNAANALLKTLEEPPGNAVLILVAHEPSRLPATIRSRCQTLVVSPPGAESATRWLVSEHGLAEQEAQFALLAAGGSPMRALAYHHQGLVKHFAELRSALETLFDGGNQIPGVLGLLGDTDPDTTWRWLSAACSERMLAGQAHKAGFKSVLSLQRAADLNRRLAKTSVRGDLLLRDWLIEWCRAGAVARG